MLFFSLIGSALLLLVANRAVRRSRMAGTTIVLSSLALGIGPVFLAFCIMPAVAIQAILLCGSAAIWRLSGRGPSFFLKLSCGATVAAYGVSAILVLISQREYASLRQRYPYESMEARLPVPKAAPDGSPLHPNSLVRLARLEDRVSGRNFYRETQLRRLHEDAVGLFINSPGFGVARMIYPSERGLAISRRENPVPVQPGSRVTSTWSPGELERLPDDEDPLSKMLEGSILDFVNDRGFGYSKDRRHVAGFEPHRFSQVPEPCEHWKVQTVELVSLLLHDTPQVYVSRTLPEMNRLHDTPTRPLDRFEEIGLDSLRRGDDLFATQTRDGARMLGAIRSAKQCVPCHGGERGALLGAFSYALRSDGP